MIKLTLNSDSDGNEYKVAKNIYVWIGVQHGDTSTIQVACTFHKTEEEAVLGQMKNTNKAIQLQAMLIGEYVVDVKDNKDSFTIDGLKVFLQEEVIKQMKAEHLKAKLTHITKFEIV